MNKSIGLTLAILLALPGAVLAATGTLTPAPYLTVLNANGAPINGACVWTYLAGTSTPTTTWTDKALSAANTNPIQATAGKFVAYLQPGVSYKYLVETACTPPAHGAVIWTQDNIDPVPASAASVDVLGTAGESISAGQAVYLSDGSGGKNAGQWYKADTANAYSSTTPEVGLAPSAITSATTGTVRLVGQVPGLSALTIGARYYVGAAGALALSGLRLLGQADTATSLILNPASPPVTIANNIVQGRVTLTTGVPVTTADVTAATTIYFQQYGGNQIALYDGTAWNLRTLPSSPISIAVPATTSTMYDVWVFDNSGTPALEVLAWTNDTTRATALVTQDGVLSKTGALTRRYVGSFRTTTVSGQTEDSGFTCTSSTAKRYIWNYYNRVRRPICHVEATASWVYGTATVRQANAAAANQLDVVVGWAEVPITVTVQAALKVSADGGGLTGHVGQIGIGEDSTTTISASTVGGSNQLIGDTNGSSAGLFTATLTKYPAVGRHVYAWLEWSDASGGTWTWYGTPAFVGGPSGPANGLSGWIEG